MKTNKVSLALGFLSDIDSHIYQRKAENFYSNANVKNKNRKQAALLKSLPVGKKGEGRRRKKDTT